MISSHLSWAKCDSEFISWSSSLLFVLCHMIRMRNRGETNIWLAMLNTQGLGDVPILPVPALMLVYGLVMNYGVGSKAFNEEYFIHGCFRNENNYSIVRFSDLVNRGLHEFFHERLHTDNPRLDPRVRELRHELLAPGATPFSKPELCLVQRICRAFPSSLQFPFAAALMTSRPLPMHPQVFIHALSKLPLPAAFQDEDYMVRDSEVDTDNLKEVELFIQLMQYTIRAIRQGDVVGDDDENEEEGEESDDALAAQESHLDGPANDDYDIDMMDIDSSNGATT